MLDLRQKLQLCEKLLYGHLDELKVQWANLTEYNDVKELLDQMESVTIAELSMAELKGNSLEVIPQSEPSYEIESNSNDFDHWHISHCPKDYSRYFEIKPNYIVNSRKILFKFDQYCDNA